MESSPSQETQATEAVERIIESGVLGTGSRLAALLSYVVEKEVEGEGDRIKAYSIAVDVMGRPADFDPTSDSIVRVEFNRLRQALKHYYDVEGKDAPLRIDIPRGTYRPNFIETGRRPAAAAAETTAAPVAPRAPNQRPWIFMGIAAALALTGLVLVVVLMSPFSLSGGLGPVDRHIRSVQLTVLPFSTESEGTAVSAVDNRMSDAIIAQLAGNSIIDVIFAPRRPYASLSDALTTISPESKGGLVLAGIVRASVAGQNLNLGLMDSATGRLIWSREYDLINTDERAQLNAIAEAITSDLQPPVLVAAKEVLRSRPPEALNAWELSLLANVSAGDTLSNLAVEKQRAEYAELALALEPNLGEAHAALASRLSVLIFADPPSDTVETREKALFHAHRAEQLAPRNASVLYDLSTFYLRMGRLDSARLTLQRTLALDAGHVYSRILLGAFDGICGAASEEMIDLVLREEAKLAVDNPARWLTLGVLARLYLSSGEPEKALEAQLQANQVGANPDMVFQNAVILNELGRTEDALAWLDRWRVDWPTLDAGHFANVALPRMCGDGPESLPVREPYLRLAADLS